MLYENKAVRRDSNILEIDSLWKAKGSITVNKIRQTMRFCLIC